MQEDHIDIPLCDFYRCLFQEILTFNMFTIL